MLTSDPPNPVWAERQSDLQAASLIGRILHVSDLHVGNGTGAIDGWFGGFHELTGGHNHNAWNGLRKMCAFVPRDNRSFLIFSGDLTAAGRSEDYDDGEKKLAELLSNFVTNVHPFCIPGNHDSWIGSFWAVPNVLWPFARRNDRLKQSFVGLPWKPARQLSKEAAIRIVAVDSDAEIWNQTGSYSNRVRARGRCVAQIDDLRQLLDSESASLTILVMHHSLSCQTDTLALDDESVNLIKTLAEGQRREPIVALTGHLHNPGCEWLVKSQEGAPRLVEFRCGTTLQERRRAPPPEAPPPELLGQLGSSFVGFVRRVWQRIRPTGTDPQWEEQDNVAFLHRIWRMGESLEWNVHLLCLDGDDFIEKSQDVYLQDPYHGKTPSGVSCWRSLSFKI